MFFLTPGFPYNHEEVQKTMVGHRIYRFRQDLAFYITFLSYLKTNKELAVISWIGDNKMQPFSQELPAQYSVHSNWEPLIFYEIFTSVQDNPYFCYEKSDKK